MATTKQIPKRFSIALTTASQECLKRLAKGRTQTAALEDALSLSDALLGVGLEEIQIALQVVEEIRRLGDQGQNIFYGPDRNSLIGLRFILLPRAPKPKV